MALPHSGQLLTKMDSSGDIVAKGIAFFAFRPGKLLGWHHLCDDDFWSEFFWFPSVFEQGEDFLVNSLKGPLNLKDVSGNWLMPSGSTGILPGYT